MKVGVEIEQMKNKVYIGVYRLHTNVYTNCIYIQGSSK